MMSYRWTKKILLILSIISLSLTWEMMYVNHPEITDVNSLINIIKIGAGYNNPMLHATILGWLFIVILNLFFSRYMEYYVLRISRSKYCIILLGVSLWWSILFSVIYLLSQEICIFFIDYRLLFNSIYIKRELLYFFSVVVVYFFDASIFSLSYILCQRKAILITCILTTTIYVLGSYCPAIFFVYNDIYLVDSIMPLAEKILIISRGAIVSFLIYIVGYSLYTKKDIWGYEN